MNPRNLPDGVITIDINVQGNPASLAGLRDIAARVLRKQLPACWTVEPDGVAVGVDGGILVRHDASACPRSCHTDDGAIADGSQRYTLPDALRMILLARLDVRVATYDEARAAIPDGNLSA